MLRKPERTPQGFLRLDGVAARVGIQEYPRPNGTIRRELRLPEDVFAATTMSGYEGAPFVDFHPRGKDGKPIRVTSDNVRQYELGTVTSAKRDGDFVTISCVVKDAKTIESIERRDMVALSVGYSVDLEETSGVHPKYGRYDAIQRNMVINHLARVPEGRAGDVAKLRVDELRADEAVSVGAGYKLTTAVEGHQHLIYPDCTSTSWSTSVGSATGHDHTLVRMPDGSVMLTENDGHIHSIVDPSVTTTDHHERGRMDPEKLNETIRQLNADLKSAETREGAAKAAADSEKLRADTAEGRIQTLTTENTELRAKAQSIVAASATEAVVAEKQRADAAEGSLRKVTESFGPAVRVRAKLERTAAVIMGDEFRMDDLSERQIQTAVVQRLDSTADVGKDVPDGVVAGRFLSLVELRGKSARSHANVAEILAGQPRVDQARVDDAAEKKRQEWRDQWKQPLPNARK